MSSFGNQAFLNRSAFDPVKTKLRTPRHLLLIDRVLIDRARNRSTQSIATERPVPDGAGMWTSEIWSMKMGTMQQESISTWLIVSGIVLAIIGLLVKAGLLSWFGHLPGDIRAEGEQYRFYFPLTSMILLSVALSLLVSLLRRFL